MLKKSTLAIENLWKTRTIIYTNSYVQYLHPILKKHICKIAQDKKLLLREWCKKNRLAQKIAISKKSTISIQSSWYSAANFCFDKGLCMIWNEGILREHKSYWKSCHDPGFQSPHRYESDLSNEVLYALKEQVAAKILEVKFGGWTHQF